MKQIIFKRSNLSEAIVSFFLCSPWTNCEKTLIESGVRLQESLTTSMNCQAAYVRLKTTEENDVRMIRELLVCWRR